MKGNISINGMDVEGAIDGEGTVEATMEGVEREEFEPFDEKLRGKVGAAIARRDALVGKISAHRRTTGEEAARAFQQRFERENEAVAAQVVEGGAGDVAGVDGLERGEEVRRNWERAVEGLGRLNKRLPETRARLERAGDVVGYLGGEKKG